MKEGKLVTSFIFRSRADLTLTKAGVERITKFPRALWWLMEAEVWRAKRALTSEGGAVVMGTRVCVRDTWAAERAASTRGGGGLFKWAL